MVGTSAHDTASLAKILDDKPNAPWMLKSDIATTCKNGKIESKKKVEPMDRQSFKQDTLSLGYSTNYRYKPSSTETTKESFPDYTSKRFDNPTYEDAYDSGYEDSLQEIPRCPAGLTDAEKQGYEEGYQDGERELAGGGSIVTEDIDETADLDLA